MRQAWREEEIVVPLDLRLVPAAVAAELGALAGLAGGIWWWTGVGVMGVIAALALIRRRRIAGRRRAGAMAAAACFLAALLISFLHWQSATNSPLTAAAARGSWVTVTLAVGQDAQRMPSSFPAPAAGGPMAGPQRWRFTASAESFVIAGAGYAQVSRITVIASGASWGDLVPGARIRVGGLLLPDPFTPVPGVTLNARTPPEVISPAPWWQERGHDIRKVLAANAAALPGDAAGLLPGLVVGDTNAIDDALTADAKSTGLTHLLAVSGSHFALLCGLAVLLLRFAGPRWAAAGGTLVLAGLVVLVGPGASVLRAAVMGGIGLIALSIGRNRTALPALAAAVIVLLFVDPELARSAGFALSVQATAGLIVLAPQWSKALQRKGMPSGWADLLAVPAAAQVVTMPIVAALSGAISMVAVPANLLAGLVVAPALVIGMACAMAGPWWPSGAAWLARTDQPLLAFIGGVAHRLARWPSARLPWPATLPWALTLTGLLAVGLFVLRHRRIRAVITAAICGAALILIPGQVVSLGWPPPAWTLVACEVGQGDGMVLSTGEPATAVVVDAGPDPALIDACLSRLGITTVPLVILTHLHSDHIAGLAGVLTGRSVGAIGLGVDREAPSALHTIMSSASARGIPVVGLSNGTHWASGSLDLSVIGPPVKFSHTDSDENNDSVVTMARIAGIRILLTGDIQPEAQQQLLDRGVDVRADVMVQPHHGTAKILASFVHAVHPRVAAIGVGLGNSFGHPTPTALEQLATEGTFVLRTDLDGDAAVCVIDGHLSTEIRGPTLPPGTGKRVAGNGGA